MSRILLIEDDVDQAEVLGFSLRKDKHSVRTAHTGREGLGQIRIFVPELIILDVLLPDLTGFELLPALKRESSAPILLLSAARCSEEDRAFGLALGAQDYLTKSHSHRELLARVKNLLELQANSKTITLSVAGAELKILADLQKLEWDGAWIRLTSTEFKILLQLARAGGMPVTYAELGTAIWGDPLMDASAIKSHVSRLRTKLINKNKDCGDKLIRNRHGLGYSLNMPGSLRMPETGNICGSGNMSDSGTVSGSGKMSDSTSSPRTKERNEHPQPSHR